MNPPAAPNPPELSIVLPAKNEQAAVGQTVEKILRAWPEAEVIVVNDGSSDNTAQVATAAGARVISQPYSMGNGAAIKTGARAARGAVIVFMDADGQHDPAHIQALLSKLHEGYDMVVGARDASGQASKHRGLANAFYNKLASWMTDHRIDDLTSGFRAVRADKFREFLHLLPNGFSYPTTCTMAFFRSAYPVAYVLKLFAPISVVFFMTGLAYYSWTYYNFSRFTNMSLLLFSASVIIFLIGLISEQITALMYRDKG